MLTTETIIIKAEEMEAVFKSILLHYGFKEDRAETCAKVFTQNSVDGIYTHGVNRFARFIGDVKKKFVNKDATPGLQNKFNGIEQWNGNSGPGILNAIEATNSVIKLSQQFGIGCVAVANTNHWMRGGTYGWQAAKAGCVFIGWTNTTALMPAWGATNKKLGNNPLVIAIPYQNEAIVLDMAMTQYSFGAMEQSALKQQQLPVFGGFDEFDKLTKDPAAIIKSQRPLPIGYWKGAGLSLLLDMLATILSGGMATYQISKQKAEHSLSQVFIAVDISKLGNTSAITQIIRNIILDYKLSVPANENEKIIWPGERVLATREKNVVHGIPVIKSIWQQIVQLK